MNTTTPPVRFSLRAVGILLLGVALGIAFSHSPLHFRPRFTPSEAYAFDLPEYVIEPPDRIRVEVTGANGALLMEKVFLVGPDGQIDLGSVGRIAVAGSTLPQVERQIRQRTPRGSIVNAEIVDYNSKVYYVIHQSNGSDEIMRMPITGSETVLDALAQSSVEVGAGAVWISRPTTSGKSQRLPVDLQAITRDADATKNFQLLPGDRLFISHSPTNPTTFAKKPPPRLVSPTGYSAAPAENATPRTAPGAG